MHEMEILVKNPSLGFLEQVVKQFKEEPHTPELVTKFWQTFLEASIKTQGLDIPVPTISCDRAQEELEALKKEGRMWVPETKLNCYQLIRIFPKMGIDAVREGSPIKDEYAQNAKGVDVEVSIDSPNRNTKEKNLEKLFKSQDRKGMRLSIYILASQKSKILTGHYFDENTVSRLLGSRYGGRRLRVVISSFRRPGSLDLGWRMYPGGHDLSWGGRSEGVKKA